MWTQSLHNKPSVFNGGKYYLLQTLLALHYSFMTPRTGLVIAKVRLRRGQREERWIRCYSLSSPIGRRDSDLNPSEVIPMTHVSIEMCLVSSALIWLWSDFQAAIFWGSLNASVENRCPPVKGFQFSSPTSAYKQDVLLQWSKQISSSVFVISGLLMSELWKGSLVRTWNCYICIYSGKLKKPFSIADINYPWVLTT